MDYIKEIFPDIEVSQIDLSMVDIVIMKLFDASSISAGPSITPYELTNNISRP